MFSSVVDGTVHTFFHVLKSPIHEKCAIRNTHRILGKVFQPAACLVSINYILCILDDFLPRKAARFPWQPASLNQIYSTGSSGNFPLGCVLYFPLLVEDESYTRVSLRCQSSKWESCWIVSNRELMRGGKAPCPVLSAVEPRSGTSHWESGRVWMISAWFLEWRGKKAERERDSVDLCVQC